jgi:hypothetical protein
VLVVSHCLTQHNHCLHTDNLAQVAFAAAAAAIAAGRMSMVIGVLMVAFASIYLGTTLSRGASKSARELGKELAKPLANIGHSFKEPAVAGAQALGGSLDDTLRSLE